MTSHRPPPPPPDDPGAIDEYIRAHGATVFREFTQLRLLERIDLTELSRQLALSVKHQPTAAARAESMRELYERSYVRKSTDAKR